MSSEKLEYARRMIGKFVRVEEKSEQWVGEVVDVKDAETLIVKKGDLKCEVDIFDVRSI